MVPVSIPYNVPWSIVHRRRSDVLYGSELYCVSDVPSLPISVSSSGVAKLGHTGACAPATRSSSGVPVNYQSQHC